MQYSKITFPAGTPLRTRLRVALAVRKFQMRFDRSTPERQDAILAYLAAQPGVTVSKTGTRP